jgi:flagellar biosynthesis protein FlhG
VNRIGPKLDANRPQVVAFGGGKGGVGRSTLCAEVARSLARREERILCVDAAWAAPSLHTLMNACEPPSVSHAGQSVPLGQQGSHIADFIEETETDNVWLTSLAAAREFPYLRPDLSAYGLIDQLHTLDFDWVFLDLSPGLDPFEVGLFALSDLPILVGAPEPGAVRVTTQFLRSALLQAVRYHPDATAYREEIQDLLLRQKLDVSLDSLMADIASEPLREIVRESAEHFEPYLVVNLVREGAEQDLGFVISHAWYRAVGIFPRPLTAVDYENRRWFYHRRTTGTNTVRSDEALSRDIETLAQMVLDVSAVDARYPRPIPGGDDIHPALRLGISEDSSRNDVRQHCRRLWEGYKRERAIDAIFEDETTRSAIAEELETLYRKVLTLPNDTFDTADGLDQTSSGAHAGLASGSSSNSEVRSNSSTHRAATAPSSSGPHTPVGGESSSEPPSDDEETNDPSPGPEADAESTDTAPSPHAGAESSEVEQSDTSPPTDESNQAAESPSSEASEAYDADPLPDIQTRDDESPGELVEALRRRESMSLQALSRQTHIGIKYLTAIEDGDIDVLPRPVYLRNYLRDIARAFDVDPDGLVHKYVERLDDDRI